ncbi:guanine nucleotide binding protein, alpha subunit [Russula compacta]|nr:guanine nucleotide binding protein, alpha subunit [Russula compacta]
MALYTRSNQKSPKQQRKQQKPGGLSTETPAQREERLVLEREAKRINDEIDAQIEIEKSERRKRRPDIRIILLGQAESGKSTILRNFQLQYAPTAFHAEAAAWRAVIDLNLVRSVNFLLNLLEEGSPGPGPGPSSSSGVGSSNINVNNCGGSSSADMRPLSPSSTKLMPLQRLTDDLRRLRMSLSPLRSIEESLTRFISPDYPRQIGVGARARGGSGSGDSDGDGSGSSSSGNTSPAALLTERAFEVSVRSGSRWKTLFKGSGKDGSGGVASKASTQGMEELKNARRVIEACREDMVALWNHPAVRASLAEQKVSLEFQSGFFLDAVDRIAAPGYQPSPADILKARIQTVGVEEYPLRMEIGLADGSTAKESGQLWSIIDVGGSRGLRAAWLPYFDDVNVLLFIAPVSAFDQTLTEDRSVNRLWDSFLLWRSLCVHKLLKKATFILLLNKYDILDAKLQSGIQFRQFVTSYKDRPNQTENVLHYLKGKFSAIYQQDSENTLNLHVHFTCATDSNSTSIVLARKTVLNGLRTQYAR